MVITSVENPKIKNIKKLNTKKYRNINNEFLIEGEHLVNEAHKNNLLKELIILEGTDFELDVPTTIVNLRVLKYITELDNPPRVMGICSKIVEKSIGNKILILDGIQDPGNLGTIIRSSVAFNIDTVVLSKNSVDLYNSKVIRATQGMIFSINIIEKDIYEFIIGLKKNGYKVYGTKVNGGKNVKDIEKNQKFAIIMGNEGKGVSSEILDLCSDYIYINMNSKCESLNVGIATSIILYELDK